jgi:hypothetical protein
LALAAIGGEAQAAGFAGNVNWIGVGPSKTDAPAMRGPIVTFQQFVDFGTDGPKLRELAPMLAKRMYFRNTRHKMIANADNEFPKAIRILELAMDALS